MIRLDKIKNIIFDLGGILINIEPKITEERFRKLGLINFNETFDNLKHTGFFDEYEKGTLSEKQFIGHLKALMPENISDSQIIDAWNALLLDFPVKRIELLEKLKSQFNIFLLSNTNITHYCCYNKQFSEQFGYSSLDSMFKKAYFSFRLNMLKPSVDIYQHVISDAGLKSDETIFIDDTLKNIEGAKVAGLNTLHIEKGDDITNYFK